MPCPLAARLPGLLVTFLVLPTAALAQTAAPTGVVFAVDGSALLRDMGPDLHRAVADAGLPLAVQTFGWSHGAGRVFSDLRGQARHRDKGQELAGRILAHRQAHPADRIVIVAHSAGAAVTLAAAEGLPAGTVDRIILLAPAVSARYDVRPALAATREGIDAYHSSKDLISLTLTMTGTTDGWNGASAGRGGFDAADPGLRQYAWQADMAPTGNWGGHFGSTRPEFLRAYVVPLLAAAPPPAGAPGEPIATPANGGRFALTVRGASPQPAGPQPPAGPSGIAPISNSLRIP